MEKRKASCVIIICVMLGMLAGESEAVIPELLAECYAACFLKCAITPGKVLCQCATHCIFPLKLSDDNVNRDASKSQGYSFCQRGCTVLSCANVSTPNNLDGATVANCVDSCGKTCAINYSP